MRKISFSDAINEALREEMRRDPRVIVTGEDVAGGATIRGFERRDAWGGVFGVTRELVSEFGRDRVIDTPISESAYLGAAIGAATQGYRTVTEIQFLDFIGVCLDQVVNQAAKLHYARGSKGSGIPLVIRAMVGAGVRAGGTQSQSFYSAMAHFPGIKVVAPANPADAKGLMLASIRDQDPVFFMEHKGLYETSGEVPEGEHLVPLGRASVVREGEDVTVVAIARMVQVAERAADLLKAEGIGVEIVDPRTIAPLDYATISASVAKTGRLVVVDEDTPRCSVASDIVGLVASRDFDALRSAPSMVTAPHTPVPAAPELEDAYTPDADQVMAAIRKVVA
ncbi:alpha-ketoacid dehydrogenase subunit beta [Nocardioides agariphilus]|uniref:Alpha-ketoacid dehydrogenase subunit beta n=1 Tax=Nocardioides agariphilus TaxID=433664 RepID=A0A930YNN5_9ACTN|nr:alpha-ketoacid dehydrogenase subunit beta [Nocardioides agariphilus]MBF4769349.1 alpha-ketoacid dehydrogenase subunit beta [Nocardioides agariphilus]